MIVCSNVVEEVRLSVVGVSWMTVVVRDAISVDSLPPELGSGRTIVGAAVLVVVVMSELGAEAIVDSGCAMVLVLPCAGPEGGVEVSARGKGASLYPSLSKDRIMPAH